MTAREMVNAVVNYGGAISFFFCFFILGFALLGWVLVKKEGGGGTTHWVHR